jgi:hypothetical protein
MMTKSNHKMRIAREALKRLAGKPATAHGSGPAPTPACVAKLDRTQGYCSLDPTPALKGIPGLMSGQGHRVRPPRDGRFQAYSRVHRWESRTSEMKLLLESERREAWLPPYRVTLYADDRTGLLPDEVFGVLEVLQDFRMTVLELAFDFAPDQMNRKFVRNHGLFGKSQPVPSIGTSDYWGSRRGSKRVQSYLKKI